MTNVRSVNSASKAALSSSEKEKKSSHTPIVYKDTIEEAKPLLDMPYEPSKPQLAFPSKESLIEYRLIDSLEKLHKTGTGMLELNMNELDDCNQKFKEMQAEQAKKLKEAAARTQDDKFWSLLKKIGAFVLAAVSTVLGMTLVATGAGALVGGAMIASGLLTIANLAFTDAGVWDWVAEKLAKGNEEKQKKIAAIIPAVVGGFCAVIGLAGSAGTFLWASINVAQKMLLIAQTALNFAEGVAAIGDGVNRYRSLRTQAALTEIKKDLFLNENKLEKASGGMEKIFQVQSRAAEQVSKMIRMSSQTNKRITTSAV